MKFPSYESFPSLVIACYVIDLSLPKVIVSVTWWLLTIDVTIIDVTMTKNKIETRTMSFEAIVMNLLRLVIEFFSD